MKYVNRGIIFDPAKHNLPWARTHGMLPVAEHVEGDLYRVYFSGRDEWNHSHTGSLVLNIETRQIESLPYRPILSPGRGFMRDGVSPLWAYSEDGLTLLYFMGWRQNKTWGVEEMTGIAELNGKRPRTFGPILKSPPGMKVEVITCLNFLPHEVIEVYYDSAQRFVSPKERYYNVKRRHFYNGIWLDQGEVVLPQIEGETRVSCLRVLGNRGWFCSAGLGDYSLGYCERDGSKWVRQPIETDGEWCAYPFPIEHKGRTFILASSREYGKFGFGLYEEV